MTTMITEVYEALKEANVSDAKAIAAATAIPSKDNLATKEDINRLDKRIDELKLELQTGLLKLENKIILWMGAMFVVAIGILGTLMKFFQSGATP